MIRERIKSLVLQCKAGKISVGSFCAAYENIFNFEVLRKEFSDDEFEQMNALFDSAVWYSESEEDLKSVPNYKSDNEILLEIEKLEEAMKRNGWFVNP
jgi:hypothetical protein